MKRAEKETKTPMTKKRILLTIGAFCVAIVLTNCGLKSKAQKAEESNGKTAALDEARQNYKEQLEKMSKNLSAPNKLVLTLLYMDGKTKDTAFKKIESNWSEIYLKRLIEVMLLTDQNTRKRIIKILETSTGKEFGANIDKWYQYLWSKDPEESDPTYYQFKALLYSQLDPRFIEYFQDNPNRTIRLDEIRWGGVIRDGIPPLRNPEMIEASKAKYLADSNIVFGIDINGDARAYPKRILAWHEMFTDNIGGTPIAGVYCTLCGSMIPYVTKANGQEYKLGTSGFLYRSNKLMYDKKTKSLWSTIEGKPAVGKLVGKKIELKVMPVVTTTWANWKKQHPNTKVLSLKTGFTRDYGEGVAYRDYFGTDELMFTIPNLDRRLKNKDSVLVLRWGNKSQSKPIAFSKDYLSKNKLYQGIFRDTPYVILTDSKGASRVYQTKSKFTNWSGADTIKDKDGKSWTIKELGLESSDGKTIAKRLPAHEAFWFGWYAAHPDTELIM